MGVSPGQKVVVWRNTEVRVMRGSIVSYYSPYKALRYLWSLRFSQIVMAVVLFLLLRRFSGTVFLNILGMLDHLTFLKDGLKLLFLYALFRFMK